MELVISYVKKHHSYQSSVNKLNSQAFITFNCYTEETRRHLNSIKRLVDLQQASRNFKMTFHEDDIRIRTTNRWMTIATGYNVGHIKYSQFETLAATGDHVIEDEGLQYLLDG